MIRSWLLRIAVIASVALAFNGIAIAQNPTAPMMTQELMGRAIKYTQALVEIATLDARLCKILEACDGTENVAFKMARSHDTGDGDHLFAIPLNADSRDIILILERPDVMYLYLTDKTAELRAAAISDRQGVRLITNEAARVGFEAELARFAVDAAMLPPTTVLPGNVAR